MTLHTGHSPGSSPESNDAVPPDDVEITHIGPGHFRARTADGATLDITVNSDSAGQGWTPAQAFLAALGADMLTAVLTAAAAEQIPASGATLGLTGDPAPRPDRIDQIRADYRFPPGVTRAAAEDLYRVGARSRLHNTIRIRPLFPVAGSESTHH